MNKDARPSAANETGACGTGGTVRARTCKTIVALGGVAGFAVGVLNLVAIAHGWTLRGYFDVLDSPIISLTEPFPGFYYRLWFPSYTFEQRTLGAILFYWTGIGLFVGWIFCVVRAGILKDIAGEKICRYSLFAGACGGTLIGSLGFLTASNGWEELGNVFENINRPVTELMEILRVRFDVLDSLPRGSETEFIFWNSAAIVYWAIIGLFIASIFCVIRIGKKRNVGEKIQVSKE